MDTRRRLTVIQHTAAEYLGLVEDHLEGRRIGFVYQRPFTASGKLPRLADVVDGLVLLGGGPWGAAGPRNLPGLVAEVNLTHACLAQGLPVIGFGLGAQILALAAGGQALAAPLELRVAQLSRTETGALNGHLPASFPQVVYGRDQCVPPTDSRVLAVDERGLPAVFQIGATAFGFCGHPGFKRAMAEDLIMEFDESPDAPLAALDAISAETPALERALVHIMTGLVQLTGLMDS